MKTKKCMVSVLTILLLTVLFSSAYTVSAAGSDAYVSLTELPIKSWVMLNSTSDDENPEYSPGINHMKNHNGEEPDSSSYYIVVNARMYEKGIETHVAAEGDEGMAVLVYDISGFDYDTFSATVGKAVSNNGGVGKQAQFFVYVDGVLKAESPVLTNIEDYYIEADISGGKELKLCVSDGGDGIANDDVAWCNPVLFKKAEIKVEKIELCGLSYVSRLGKDLSFENVFGRITYNSGAEKQVSYSDVAVSGFYKDIEGLQTITLSYGGYSDTQKVYVAPAGAYEYVCDMEWESYVMLDGSSEELLTNNEPRVHQLEKDDYPLVTGGVTYEHGLWCHPTPDEETNGYAEIVYSVGGRGYTNFHTVVGKGNDTYCYLGQYHIYVDGKLVESSPVLHAGNTHEFNINIKNASTVSLVITGGEEGEGHESDFYWWDSTAWADPVVYKSIGAANVPIETQPIASTPVVNDPAAVSEPVNSVTAAPETFDSSGTIIAMIMIASAYMVICKKKNSSR